MLLKRLIAGALRTPGLTRWERSHLQSAMSNVERFIQRANYGVANGFMTFRRFQTTGGAPWRNLFAA